MRIKYLLMHFLSPHFLQEHWSFCFKLWYWIQVLTLLLESVCSCILGKTTKPSMHDLLEQQNSLIPSLAHLGWKYNLLLKQPCTQLGVIQPAASAALIHKDQFTEGSLQLADTRWWLWLPEGVGWQIQVAWNKSRDNAVPQNSAGCLLSVGI